MVDYGRLRETREPYGVGGGISVEEVPLFEGRTKERVERYINMLDEMWTERRRLIKLRERTDVT